MESGSHFVIWEATEVVWIPDKLLAVTLVYGDLHRHNPSSSIALLVVIGV